MIFKTKISKIHKNIFVKTVSFILATVILSLSALGCQQQSGNENVGDQNLIEQYKCLTDGITAKPVAERKVDGDFRRALSDFASEMMMLSVHGTENIALSPTAIMSSLLLIANGASSAAQSEIVALFGGKISASQFNEYMATYLTMLERENNCALSSSFWVNKGESSFTPKSSFLQLNANYYMADGYCFNGANVDTTALINKWLTNESGLIDVYIPSESPVMVQSLATVSGFSGGMKWKSSFYAVKEGTFYTPYGEKAVNYMYSEESVLINLGTATGFVKELEGGLKVVALLPKEDVKLSVVLTMIDVMGISDILKYAVPDQSVTVRIPEFSYRAVTDCTDLLKKCGLKRTVSSEYNSFDGLGTGASLYLSNVLNAVSISFGAEGIVSGSPAQAAGTSDGEIVLPETVDLDYNRPFIYIVYDADGVPMYFGNVVRP